MKSQIPFKDGVGGDPEAVGMLKKLFQAEYEAYRKLHPDKEFTSVDIAEIIGRTKAAAGFDTSKKMDPAEIERNREADLKLMLGMKAFLDKASLDEAGD